MLLLFFISSILNHSTMAVERGPADKTPIELVATQGTEKEFKTFLDMIRDSKVKKALNDSRGTPVIVLLASMANPASKDCAKYESMVRMLLDEFPKAINDQDRAYIGDGRTALHQAATYGNMRVIKELVTRGASVNEKNSTNETPLHLAARFGRLDAVKYLLTHGAKINEKSKYTFSTPLMYAAEMGHESVIRYLLESGAETDIKDTFGKTAPERFKEYVIVYQSSKKQNLR